VFSDLVKIVGFVKGSIVALSKLKSIKEREDALIEMLKIYFLLLDVREDGHKLLEMVDRNPMEFIRSLNKEDIGAYISVWDKVLRKQGMRLYTVQQYLSDQSYLFVLNPDAVRSIKDVIGYKMNSVVSLHEIGANLTLRNAFRFEESPETIAGLVNKVLTKNSEGVIDKNFVQGELDQVKVALDEFRSLIDSTMSKEEMLKLSSKARSETEITW